MQQQHEKIYSDREKCRELERKLFRASRKLYFSSQNVYKEYVSRNTNMLLIYYAFCRKDDAANV